MQAGSRTCRRFAAPVILFGLLGLLPPLPASAACDESARLAIEAGEVLEVGISASDGTVKIRTPGGVCEETLGDWARWDAPAARRPTTIEPLPAPPEASPQTPAPAPAVQSTPARPSTKTAPPPVARERPPAPAEVRPTGPRFPTETRSPPSESLPSYPVPWRQTTCAPLSDYWRPAAFLVDGKVYHLARIFTIDQNGDNVVDNVGFILESAQAGALIVRYHARPGMFSASTVHGLGIEDGTAIARLCFGESTFSRTQVEAAPPLVVPFRIPNLAAQLKEKEASALPPAKPKSPEPPLEAHEIAFGMTFFGVATLLGGAIAFVVIRRRRRREPPAPPDLLEELAEET